MRRVWASFSSEKHARLAGRLFAGTLVSLTLAFGMAGPALAQRTCGPANLGDTCPVTGTAGFETGLHDLAFLRLDTNFETGVEWGDGQQSAGLIRCFEPILHPRQCHVFGTHAYAAPGTYTIRISYVPGPFSDRQTATTTATISPAGDFVILSIGDSVASGEGNPLVQFSAAGMQPPKGFWDDPGSNYDFPEVTEQTPPEEAEMSRNCHRSFIGGPALAVGLVAATNPVTFVHFACSGAAVGQIGIPESDYPGRSNIVQQLRIARKHLPRIDILLISGGFNNMTFRGVFYNTDRVVRVGFGALVVRCLNPVEPCQEDPDFTTDINDSINGNPDRVLRGHEEHRPEVEFRFPGLHRAYQDLEKEIHCINPDNDTPEPGCSETQIPKLVLITEFFDPTHDETGNFAGCIVPRARWAYIHSVITDVNRQVHLSPWPAVVGIQDDFLRHGLCADSANRWVVRLAESFGIQNDKNGTGHPNGAGHADYRDRIYAKMVELNPPVTTANATAGGQPYPFGTWTAQDVQVTLAARNPIRESGVRTTYFAVDNPACAPPAVISCSLYAGPFVIGTSGTHTVRFFSENQFGAFEAVNTVVVRIDKDPPRMACGGTPPVLWPPNGKMVPVTTTVEAVDDVSGPVPFVLTSVGTSEGNAAADIQGFVVGEPDTGGLLRARRSGFGPGRDYTLIYEAADELGNTGSCTVVVTVPHDQRRAGR